MDLVNNEDKKKSFDNQAKEIDLINSSNKKNQNKNNETDPFFVELIKIVFVSLLIILPIRTFIFQPFFVQGASMEPNFHEGEYLIVNELGYKKTKLSAGKANLFTVEPFKEFNRGDAVVFKYPLNPKKYFIKRIVGLPGERLEIRNGKVFIYNDDFIEGFELKESDYLPSYVETKGEEKFNLDQGEYVVLGDNRSHSSDSRAWGALSEDYIVGRVLLRAWPLTNLSIF